MHLLRSGLLLCVLTIVLAAQSPKPASFPPGVVHAVVVRGNKIYSSAAIVNVLGLKTGSTASAAAFDEAKNRLVETDLFSNVAYEFRWTEGPGKAQYQVTYTVTEYDHLFSVRFEDLGVPDDTVRNYLRSHIELYHDSIPATQPVLSRYSRTVQEFIAQTKPSIKIKAAVSPESPANPVVVIRPDVPLPRVTQVYVAGNKVIDTATLQRALNEIAIGQRLSDTGVQQILDKSVRPLYAAKGYVAVSFPKIEMEKSKDNEGYIVHIQIQDGPQFHFGASNFRGSLFSADDIRSMMTYKIGEPFDGDKAEQLRQTLVRSMRRKGYLNATSDLARNEDDKKLVVNLVYTMAPGAQYNFQSLTIHGLDIESEPAVRKLWAPQPGKPFNPEYPDFFLKRIRDAALFDNLGTTRSSFKQDDDTHTVTVDLFFKGAEAEEKKAKENGLPSPTGEPREQVRVF